MQTETFEYPIHISKCQQHRLATRLNRGHFRSEQKCSCCGLSVGDPQPITNNKLQKHLAVTQFLAFHSSVFMMLFLSCTLITSLFVAFLLQCPMYNNGCQYDIFMRTTCLVIINQSNLVNSSMIYMIFTQMLIVWHVGIQYGKGKVVKQSYFQNYGYSLGQFAIKINGLPANTTDDDIRLMVSNCNNSLTAIDRIITQNLKIHSIIRVYNNKKMLATQKKNIKTFKQAIKNNTIQNFVPEQHPRQQPSSLQYCQASYIIFKRKQSAQHFIKMSTPTFKDQFISLICYPYVGDSKFQIKDKNIEISQACEPDDVIWDNCQVGLKERLVRKTVFDTIAILLTLLGGYMQVQFKVISMDEENQEYGTIISIASGIAVSLYTQILYFYLILSTKLQKPHSTTEQQKILILRLSFYGFINSGLFPIACDIFSNLSAFQLDQNLCIKIMSLIVSNQIINLLSLGLLDYFDIIGWVKRYFVRKNLGRGRGREWVIITQTQANGLYQNLELDFAYRYSYVISTVWIMLFYAALVPIVFYVSLIGMAFNYLIVYKLISNNKIKRPKALSPVLFETACLLLVRNLFFIAISVSCLLVALLYTNVITSINLQTLILYIILDILGILCWFITGSLLNKFFDLLIKCGYKLFPELNDKKEPQNYMIRAIKDKQDIENSLKITRSNRAQITKAFLQHKQINPYIKKFPSNHQKNAAMDQLAETDATRKYNSLQKLQEYELIEEIKKYDDMVQQVLEMEMETNQIFNQYQSQNSAKSYANIASRYCGYDYSCNPYSKYCVQYVEMG